MEPSRIQELLAPYVPQPLAAERLTAVSRYLDLLIRWNQRMNLTAIREPEEIVRRHFGESLFAASKLLPSDGTEGGRVADVGSGAGFPGLAMRIYAPVKVTLIESRQRKAAFLREAARVLEFPDVEVFNARAESYVAPASEAQLTVTLRAVEKYDEALAVAAAILACWSRERAANRCGGTGKLALLIGAGQTRRTMETEPGFTWGEPLAIPQSRERVLLIGERHFLG